MTNLLEKFNKAKTDETSKNKKKYTEFDVGDTIIVAYRITEGNNTRVQNFEGIVIAICTMCAYLTGLKGDPLTASTMAFATICLARLLHGFNCRSSQPLSKIGFFTFVTSIFRAINCCKIPLYAKSPCKIAPVIFPFLWIIFL